MKVKITIDDGNGKKAELEINNADKTTQSVLIHNVFELFGINTDFTEREQKMSKIEKAYSQFFDEVNPIETEKETKDTEEIKEQMIKGFENNVEELAATYKEQNDQPDFVRTGIKVRNNKNYYRLHYRCYACYDKNSLYIPNDTKYVWCRRCNQQLDVQLATNDPFPARDSFGNFFVAGDFRDWNISS